MRSLACRTSVTARQPSTPPAPFLDESVGLMKNRAVHIRPELLHSKGTKVQQDVGQPTLANLCPGTVLGRIIRRRNSRCCAGPQDLGSVKSFPARVRARDHRPRYSVKSPFEKAAMAQGVVSAVLMQNNWQNALNPEVFICLVCQRMPIVSTVSGSALAKCRISVRPLADTCLDTDEDKRRIVEAIQG